jgi:hypothetical protein
MLTGAVTRSLYHQGQQKLSSTFGAEEAAAAVLDVVDTAVLAALVHGQEKH